MEDDRRRWDERYAGQPPPVPAPPEALGGRPDLLDLAPRAGRALDVACGTGAVSLWAAARGLHVVALDVSPVAVRLLQRAAEREGLAHRVSARVADLDHGLPVGDDAFDLVVCQRFRDPRLYLALVEVARPGGVVVVTVLSAAGAVDAGPFHAPAGELGQAFGDASVEVLHEAEGNGVASVVLRRLS